MMGSRVQACLLGHRQLGSCVWGRGVHVSLQASILIGICIPCDSAQGGESIRVDLG